MKLWRLLCILFLFILSSISFALPAQNGWSALTFEQRVTYQRTIEQIYWRHRIWPKENKSSKPAFDTVITDSFVRAKVEDYLKKSNALAEYWKRPIQPEQLQAEIDRMIKNTRQPAILQEIFAALGNDPRVIAECLARPTLVERLIRNWYSNDDRFHGRFKEQQSFGNWWSSESDRISSNIVESPHLFDMSNLPSNPCANDTWFPTSETDMPNGRTSHSTVWTGTEMIVWGGVNSPAGNLSTGARYNPATDSWIATSTTNAPTARWGHSGVWTGSQMIIWGGQDASGETSTGGVYNPSTDSWSATSNNNVPEVRVRHTAVWTGNVMIVWGGSNVNGFLNTGGKYDPSTNSWSATTLNNAPIGRYLHTAVWTGSEMIVWGGFHQISGSLSNGGRYDPSSDSWTATNTSGAPSSRVDHTAVWTGMDMIIWGGNAGSNTNTGSSYNPLVDAWTPLTTTNAPSARGGPKAVWTGSEMIVWGGYDNNPQLTLLNTGGRYDVSSGSWTATSTVNAPPGRSEHSAIWTGSEMIIIAGSTSSIDNPASGGRYDPSNDTWVSTRISDVPQARSNHTIVWTGTEMIVWGGSHQVSGSLSSGGRYDPAIDNWTPTTEINAPEARVFHSAVFTGVEMIIWGGFANSVFLSSGGRYNTFTNTWTATQTNNAPDGRLRHTAVWADDQMIVWGGQSAQGHPINGGRYDPSTDSWTGTNTNNAPSGREFHTAIWAGTEMIVWGGGDFFTNFSSGGKYNPSTDSWTPTNTNNAPQMRTGHSAIFVFGQMIIWGGANQSVFFGDGARYSPSNDSWTPISNNNAPSPRTNHSVVMSGAEMIVWGGGPPETNTGGRYDVQTDSWLSTSVNGAPLARHDSPAIWTGTEMIVWGGSNGAIGALNTGGRYCASFLPAVYIDSSSVLEGNSGTVDMNFSVNTFVTSTQDITIYYETADDTATIADNDYQSANSSITIPAGQTTGTITIHVNGDTKLEDDETFFVNITSATNATIGDGQGVGSIDNDDSPPSLTISDITQMEPEPSPGLIQVFFTVTLSTVSAADVDVDFTTLENTATKDVDYQHTSGTLTIPAGSLSGTIPVTLIHDGLAEGDETYFVNLSNPVNATIADAQGEGTIVNREPYVHAGPFSANEGNNGTTTFTFTIHNSFAYSLNTSFNYTTQNGSAVAPGDYTAQSGTLTIPAFSLSNTITVEVIGDTTFEADEAFQVQLSNCTPCSFANDTGNAIIFNDDSPSPALSIDDISVTEGNSGTKNFIFTVSLQQPTSQAVKVLFGTAFGTANSTDFKSVKPTKLNIPAGSLSTTVAVKVNGDTVLEPNETFFGLLSNPQNAIIADGSGTATILNDD